MIFCFRWRLPKRNTEAAFKDDLNTVRQYGVRGFPTFFIRYETKEVLMRGYQSYESIKAVIKTLAGDSINEHLPEKSEEGVLDFIKKYGRVAPVEIQNFLECSQEDVERLVADLKAKNLITIIPAGNGVFIDAVNSLLSCDPVTGVCRILAHTVSGMVLCKNKGTFRLVRRISVTNETSS